MSDGDENSQSAAQAEDFEDLYENAPCGYVSMRLDGCLFKVNATFASWIGSPPEQIVGKRLFDLLTVGTRILYETSFAPLLNLQGFFDEVSLDLRTADGKTVAVLASGALRRDPNGPARLIRMIFVRATERRRYERQLVEAREQSQALERATQGLLEAERSNSELREQFIAVLGHDLRNPLTAIFSGLRLLQKDNPAERREYIFKMLEGAVLRMGALIDNVLDFARGRLGGGIPVELRADVVVKPILEQVVSELRLGAPDRVIETDFRVSTPIKCDPSRIGQLVSNLLGNALTHGCASTPVRVHSDADGGILTIWVANGGDPISPDAMARLFQPFFRGEVRRSMQGLGLGLHIAAEIAKAHGGELDVDSSAKETRFTFRMPVAAVV
jgi:sigma-B regulation protein RsbU (phosphoserine phosphatase)